ncbi:MAG: hypothetical protein KC800_19055 [Candidatus Eremiobacteraeota bacterium]|nr:hypothetical protein [Candidatus Eremiobacteraeota bacterium]
MTTSVEIPKGGSPETQAIIDACYQGNWAGAQQLVAPRQVAGKQALDSFMGQARQQGEEFLTAHKISLQRVEDAFGKYQQALASVAQAAQTQNSEEARKAATELAVASFGIRSAVVGYEESYLSYGDSRYPLINLLTNMGERVRNGELPQASWTATCGRYGEYFTKAAEEVQNSKEQGQPGVAERQAALLRASGVFQQLVALTSQDARAKFEDLLFDLSGCLADLSDAFEKYHTHVFLTGKSSSPRINLILKVAQGVMDGTYDKAVLRALATDLSDEIVGRLKELDRLSQKQQESALMTDCLAEMIEVLESIDDGLQALIAVANGEPVEQGEIQESLDILLESGDVLTDLNKTIAQYNQAQSTVTCPGCGANHEAGLHTCSACGANLPLAPTNTSSVEMQEGAEDEMGQPVMTTVLQELFQKVEEFDGGRMDVEQFIDCMEDFDQRIDLAEQKLSQIHPPEMPDDLNVEQRAISNEFITIAEDALSLLEVGLAECREGIAHLRHFAETDEEQAMESGKQLYFDGTQKMWLVARAQQRVDDFIRASAAELGATPQGGGATGSANFSFTSRFSDEMR